MMERDQKRRKKKVGRLKHDERNDSKPLDYVEHLDHNHSDIPTASHFHIHPFTKRYFIQAHELPHLMPNFQKLNSP